MKQLHTPAQCSVLLERDGRVGAVRYQGRPWTVEKTIETWTWRGEWWRDVSLEGDERTYHRLATKRGEIVVYEHVTGWYVSGWWD